MNRTVLQRLGLFVTFLFALACCASVSTEPAAQSSASEAPASELELRLVYSADTKGNYQPCPT